jgi:archaemetzincin
MGAAEGPEASIDVVPLGVLDPGLATSLVARLSGRIQAACRLRPRLLLADVPRVEGRDQADADALLARLEATVPPATIRVGLTAIDIAVPIFTFVFGRARRAGCACLVSLARLDPAQYGLPPEPQLLLERAVTEILHELGHVAGLDHCRESSCLMSFAASVQAIDVRGSRFCRECTGHLPRWLRSAG